MMGLSVAGGIKIRTGSGDFHFVGVCSELLRGKTAFAVARISGGANHPDIAGVSEFYRTPLGILITAEIRNLPADRRNLFASKPYALSLSGNEREYSAFPTLFASGGYAWCAFLAGKACPSDIAGYSVIIREGAIPVARGAVQENPHT